jgi:tRNA-2-methylthio-N6-dimethylallyladenosine synthase
MNRQHTRADYLEIIARMRAARADMAFSSDFIVGFPGEREEDVEATLSLIDEVGYAGAFSFKYSPRSGTPAAAMPDQIGEDAKLERLRRVQAAIDRYSTAFNSHCVQRTFEVLFEKPGRHPGQIVGRSPYLQPVQVMAPHALIGKVAAVSITEAGSNSLFGVLARDMQTGGTEAVAIASN